MADRLSRHAEQEMAKRGIGQAVVAQVLRRPEQIVDATGGRRCYQARWRFEDGVFLVRVIVARDGDDRVVVTVYRTGRIAKYWRQS